MKFAEPQFNYLFFILLGVAFLCLIAYRRKQALLDAFASRQLLATIAAGRDKRRQQIRTFLILIAFMLGVLALMRPQRGFYWEEVRDKGVDIFVAVDVSKSMLTKDVLPSRLGRVKLAIEDLVYNLRADRIGLIAFAGSAFVQCPLTVDYDGFLLAVEDLDVNAIARGGTNIEQAINEAIKSFAAGSEGTDKILIIISDGESHEGDPVSAAERAKKATITIHTIGVGTKEGELITVVDEQGNQSFLKDRSGQVVKSRLNETLLRNIAQKTAGTYVKAAATRFGLDVIYEQKIAPQEKKEGMTDRKKRFQERFQIPLALALLLIILELFISERRKT